jgi:hypothetical protein
MDVCDKERCSTLMQLQANGLWVNYVWYIESMV